MLNILDDTVNPVEPFLRSDRMPHIWCPGCGIGTTVNSFARALIDSKIDLDWAEKCSSRPTEHFQLTILGRPLRFDLYHSVLAEIIMPEATPLPQRRAQPPIHFGNWRLPPCSGVRFLSGPTHLCIVHWERWSQSLAPPVRYSGGGTRSFKTRSVVGRDELRIG